MPETGASPLPPTPPASSPLFRAEHFVWLTARVLEQRLFAHHFLNGAADPVETALDAYRNEDGGFGHALEPDLRGPVSQPLHTAHALRVLDSIGRCGGQRVERVCRYLTSVSTPDGALPAVHPSQRGYPAAPFVPIVDDPPSDLLATGPVVGLLHRNEVWHAWLFRATDYCWQRIESLDRSHPYEIEAAVTFLDAAADRKRAEAAADRLGRLVRDHRLAALDPEHLEAFPVAPGYAPEEHHFPYDYARTPGSLARAWFTDDEMNRSLDFLASRQREDGGWPITWRQWAPGVALEARPMVTIEALRTLRAYGRAIG
ncbi:prenyltransferase/squalene oxidase repeat-containing protein [Streptomyces sp. NPDC086766]|uniref:prenyltransferase/squalene oxidase repeat-containing protein n=1 Tax=Streptomyces sp. NPDC086766 TaxID=3365754 RepID=UPI00381ECBE3